VGQVSYREDSLWLDGCGYAVTLVLVVVCALVVIHFVVKFW
jgi:hypothetical protein